MIEMYTEQLGGIEVLHAVPAGQKESKLPVVVFYHGFTSSKLVYSYFAVAIAQAGMRVIMPDAEQHGSRFDGDNTARLYQFWSILKQSIDEFSQLHQALCERYLVDEALLMDRTRALGGALLDPIKTTVVQDQRSMTTWVVRKNGSRSG